MSYVAPFRDAIPASIWTREKMGFGVPIARWFRGELREMLHDLLLAPNARVYDYFQPETVRRWADEHDSGQVNHCYRLWNLLFLEKWMRLQQSSPRLAPDSTPSESLAS